MQPCKREGYEKEESEPELIFDTSLWDSIKKRWYLIPAIAGAVSVAGWMGVGKPGWKKKKRF